MRGTVAKRMRRKIYGVDFSPRARSYSVKWVKAWKRIPSPKDKDKFDWIQVDRPIIHADAMRQRYQQEKSRGV